MNHGQQLIYIYELRACRHTHTCSGKMRVLAQRLVSLIRFKCDHLVRQVSRIVHLSVFECVCVCVHVVAAKVVDSVDHSPLWSGNVISYTEEGDSKRLL